MVYECVPNFSVSQNRELIDSLEDTVHNAGLPVLNVHSDPYYNRTVFTFLGTPDKVAKASFNMIACASARIDMKQHVGEHPRLGATDVCPWIALDDDWESQCVADLRNLARRVAEELNLCVYLYGKAALRHERRRLTDIRRGEFEAWYQGIGVDPRWQPDLGSVLPRSCGPVVLGVRPILIAINYVLDSNDLKVARRIAKRIRHPDCVQARGFRIGDTVHVSCNLLDYRVRKPRWVFDQVQDLARLEGTEVSATDLVGMLPAAALDEGDVEAMRIQSFSEQRLLDFWYRM